MSYDDDDNDDEDDDRPMVMFSVLCSLQCC